MERKKVAKENHYFSEKTETMSREEMKQLQFGKTRDILSRAYSESDFYRNHFDKANVKPEHFKTLEDIARFPFIEKQDVVQDQVEHPPYGNMICSPPGEIRRINQTSGTSGMGQEVHCHDEDAIWAANASTASHFAAIGLQKGDLSALLYPLGTMTGGMLSYEGLRMLGATPLPLAIFNTNQKIDIMQRFNVHHFSTTPAYLSRITSICMERGIKPQEVFSQLKGITLSTEPFPVAWALKMEDIWGTIIHDIFGSTQLNLNY
ncbi:MAG: phenylacetate--CoA ligase family protein, partial [Proteobacteria bacterium]|nr:phenylacetate--CoA ligase family protein [Pseudomonadota bacterium]